MNCRGDDDVDAKRSRPSIGKTREVPREERARAFGRDSISESHQGRRPYTPQFSVVWRESRSGKLKVQEDVIDGLENTPKALIGLLAGENRGKRMVKV